MLKNYEEFIGQQFGEWTILSFAGKKNKTPYMTCRCSCGKIKEVSLYSMKQGASKSCGHKRKEDFRTNNPNPIKNEIGNKYGRLVVIERAYKEGETRAFWKCRCECGNNIIVSGKQLRSGNTKSCGCLRKEKASETANKKVNFAPGYKFNKLTVLDETYIKNRNRMWKCRCDCGNEIWVSTADIHRLRPYSCGCIVSKGEAVITSILQEHNINFKKQYSFDDLYINTGKAKFDFAILDKENHVLKLIEYQGYQHYDSNDIWYNGESDKKKQEYCQKNNIQLIEIPYVDFKKLSWEYLKEKCNL